MALTAATWSLNFRTGSDEWLFQMSSLLSLPPEQSCCQSKLHLSPHISCLCPTSLFTNELFTLKSRCRIVLSLDPVLRIVEFHEIAPTLFVWPCKILSLFILFTSQICTSPLLVPKPKCGPFTDQETDVAESEIPKSQSFVTLELLAFQRYTLEARPTARKFWLLQSMRLRQQSSCRAGASSTLHGSLFIFLLLVVPVDSSSVNQRLEFLQARGISWVLVLFLRVYLSMLLFSKDSISFYLPWRGPSAMMKRLYRSPTLSELFYSFAPSFSCQLLGSSSWKKESFLSSFRLGMKRSVTAHLYESSRSSQLPTSRQGLKGVTQSGQTFNYS